MARERLFAFLDCSRDPGEVWRDLFAAIFPKAHARLRNETRPVQWMRFRVLNRRPEDPRRHALVLDNFARLTPHRLDAVRRLRARYQVVVIVEDFLPEAAIASLCSALWARPPLRLGHLNARAAAAFLEECSRSQGFGWRTGEIQGLARATRGFPLGMRAAVDAERRRRNRLVTVAGDG